MKRKILILVFTGIITGFSSVFAQTGTRIDKESLYPGNVIWFDVPREIVDIRVLLQEGKSRLAVNKARAYVATLEHVSGAEARIRYYFGLNALCSALTANKQLAEAIDTCSQAIELISTKWQAFNNRGTAYYQSRKFNLALEDYRHALTLASGEEYKTEIIQHNIRLVESKR